MPVDIYRVIYKRLGKSIQLLITSKAVEEVTKILPKVVEHQGHFLIPDSFDSFDAEELKELTEDALKLLKALIRYYPNEEIVILW